MNTAFLLLPDVLLVLLGLLLHRREVFSDTFWSGLEKLIFFMLFPALLFVSVMKTEFDFGAMARLLQISLLTSFAGIVLGYAAKIVVRTEGVSFASGVQCAFRFNSYIGLALAGRVGGDAGIALMALVIGLNIPLCNIAAVWGLAHHGRKGVLKEVARNPLVVTTVVALACNAAGVKLPEFLSQTLGRLGNASLALALLSVGAGLRLSGAGRDGRLVSWWLVVKLLAMPLFAWGLVRAAGLTPLQQQIAVAFAALPAAPSAYILAARMGGNGPMTAFLISAGTLGSIVTLPLWLGVFM